MTPTFGKLYAGTNPKLPIALQPIYATTAPNKDIELFRGSATIKSSTVKGVSGDCTLNCRWLPDAKVVFEMDCELGIAAAFQLMAGQSGGDALQLEFDAFKPSGNCVLTGLSDRIRGVISGDWSIAKSENIKVLNFHLANWPLIHGVPIRYDDPTGKGFIGLAGRIELNVDDWQVIIDPVWNHEEMAKATKTIGGYCITHVGQVNRLSQALFSVEEADGILTALHWFLSFAHGSWAGPMLPVGFDSQMERTWWNFGPRICDRWRDIINWFAHEGAVSLSQLWPLFYRRWQDAYWKDTLTRAIWWYVAAAKQSGGSDASLILAQAGLELLAWAKLVETEKIVSQAGFDGLPTADKLRLLVAAMKLQMELDPGQRALHGLAMKQGWMLGPWALTEVRNRLVHPKHRDDLDGQGLAVYEAYALAMHYLELAILFICDYRGSYTNRLTATSRFETERVPWAK